MLDTCCLLQEGWKRQWGNEPWHYVASLEEVSSVEFCYMFFLNVVERRSCMFCYCERKRLSLLRRKSQMLEWFCLYCSEASSGGNCAMHDPAECFLLYAPVLSFSPGPDVWPQPDWKSCWQQMQNIQAHFFTLLFGLFLLLIFCISESTCPLTTVVNIGRVIIPLSVRGVHPSVASCSIFSERKHYISVDLVFTCREDGACTQSSVCPSVYC